MSDKKKCYKCIHKKVCHYYFILRKNEDIFESIYSPDLAEICNDYQEKIEKKEE